MHRVTVFGRWEGVSLVVLSICTQIFLNTPRFVSEEAGTAGWILTLYVSVVSLLIFVLITLLYRNFEGRDLIDIAQETFGKTGRIIFGTILLLYFVYILSMILRGFSENMKIISLNLSPISFVTFFFAACMTIAALLGIEAIARVCAIAVPVIIIGYMVIAFGVSGHVQLSKITPVFGAGLNAIFVEGISKISIFSELIVLFLITPFLKTNKNFKAVGYWGIGLSAFFLTLSALIYLLIYAYPSSIENFLPMYQLARMINYGRFFQRVESVFLIIWSFTAFLYLSVFLFFTTYIFQKSFELKYYRPLVLPFSILIFSLSLIPENLVGKIQLESRYFRQYSWVVTFGFTILLLLAGNIIKNKKEGNRQNVH